MGRKCTETVRAEWAECQNGRQVQPEEWQADICTCDIVQRGYDLCEPKSEPNKDSYERCQNDRNAEFNVKLSAREAMVKLISCTLFSLDLRFKLANAKCQDLPALVPAERPSNINKRPNNSNMSATIRPPTNSAPLSTASLLNRYNKEKTATSAGNWANTPLLAMPLLPRNKVIGEVFTNSRSGLIAKASAQIQTVDQRGRGLWPYSVEKEKSENFAWEHRLVLSILEHCC